MGRKKLSPEEKLNQIYEGLINRLEKIEDFTLEHAPDVCKEIVESKVIYYQNKAIVGFLGLLLSIVLLAISSYCAYVGLTTGKEVFGGISLVTGVPGLALFFGAGHEVVYNLLEIREVRVSTKLVVLRALKRLIK